jgi:hypothetical protein
MTNLRNFFKQNLRLVLVVLCGFLTVWGVLTLVLGGGDSEGWLKAVFIIFGIVLILLGCTVLLMAAALGQSEKANFFLYDSKKKANVPLEELDFARVDRKMMKVMTRISSNASEVWTGNVFDRYDEEFADNDAYRPLVAYKILYDLGEHSNESVWNLYLLADPAIIDAIVASLEENGDTDLGDAFKFLYKNANGSYERTAKFLEDNKKYICNKMVKYVKANISRF